MTEKKLIHFACKCENLKAIKYLINKKSKLDLNSVDYSNQYRQIHYACFSVCLNPLIIKLLLEKNIDLEVPDKNGLRPIHMICINGNLEILKLLLEKNVHLEVYDKDGMTPIHYACKYGHIKIILLLLEKNVNLEVSNENGLRPIHYASITNLEILKLLLEKNVYLEVCDNKGKKPIHYISGYYHTSIQMLNLLIDNKMDLEAIYNNEWRPIHYACAYSSINVIETLVDKVNCHHKTNKGETPFDLFMKRGFLKKLI